MPTLLAMRQRIQRETRRGATIDADIDAAIATAIQAFRHERFRWAESRTTAAFNTVALQEFYTSVDDEALGRLISIDWVVITVGNQPYRMTYRRPAELDTLSNGITTGQPTLYTWYQDQLRFWPIPSAAFPVRVAGRFSVPAPATDDEVGNPWMTTAERLIRSRAVLELAIHRLRDRQLAEDMSIAVEEALSQLHSENTLATGTGFVEPFF